MKNYPSSQTLIPQVMYADSTMHNGDDDDEDDALIGSEIDPNRPLVDSISDENPDV